MIDDDKQNLTKFIGRIIRYERTKRQLSIKDFAQLMEFSPQMVKSIESGSRGTTIENLIKAADIFNVSLDYITGRDIETVEFHSPESEIDKSTELQALCACLNDEQTNLVLNFVKNLIAYTDEITVIPDNKNK